MEYIGKFKDGAGRECIDTIIGDGDNKYVMSKTATFQGSHPDKNFYTIILKKLKKGENTIFEEGKYTKEDQLKITEEISPEELEKLIIDGVAEERTPGRKYRFNYHINNLGDIDVYWEDYFEARDKDAIETIDEQLSGKLKKEDPKTYLALRLKNQRIEQGKNAKMKAESMRLNEKNKGQVK